MSRVPPNPPFQLVALRWSLIIDALANYGIVYYFFNVFYQFSAYFEVVAFVPIAFSRWTAIVHPMAHQRVCQKEGIQGGEHADFYSKSMWSPLIPSLTLHHHFAQFKCI